MVPCSHSGFEIGESTWSALVLLTFPVPSISSLFHLEQTCIWLSVLLQLPRSLSLTADFSEESCLPACPEASRHPDTSCLCEASLAWALSTVPAIDSLAPGGPIPATTLHSGSSCPEQSLNHVGTSQVLGHFPPLHSVPRTVLRCSLQVASGLSLDFPQPRLPGSFLFSSLPTVNAFQALSSSCSLGRCRATQLRKDGSVPHLCQLGQVTWPLRTWHVASATEL